MNELTVITNNAPRPILDAYELTLAERKEFDYLNWDAIEQGSDSASFVRYLGELYDLGEFMNARGLPEFSPLVKWDGYREDSFFSGILVRYVWGDPNYPDGEYVVVGRYYS
jgi:hypothetical protein